MQRRFILKLAAIFSATALLANVAQADETIKVGVTGGPHAQVMEVVKQVAAKLVASTRCWSSACDETSIATVSTPSSRIAASIACNSVASGVVCAVESARSPTHDAQLKSRSAGLSSRLTNANTS